MEFRKHTVAITNDNIEYRYKIIIIKIDNVFDIKTKITNIIIITYSYYSQFTEIRSKMITGEADELAVIMTKTIL